MRLKKITLLSFLLPVSLFFLLNCSNEEPKKLTVTRKEKLEYALQPDSIYMMGSIQKALAAANQAQKSESRKQFMNGLDLLVNKNNPNASIEFFKEAIYYYPDEKSYSHLFDAYLKNNNLSLADSINTSLFGRIEYTENIFNMALLAAARGNKQECLGNLEEAAMNGFAFKERIVNEKLFDFIKDNQSFQSLMVSYFGNDEVMRKTLFTAFLKTFPELKFPYEIPKDSVQSFNYDHYIHYDFSMFVPGMEDAKFSRDVSSDYMYVGKFKTENGLAIVFKSMEMMADTLNPVATHLVTYDSLGNVLSNEIVSCFCSPLQSKACRINPDLSVDVTTYKSVWEADPLEKGYAGNKVVSTEETGNLKFIFTRENKLEEVPKKEAVASGN